MSDTAPILERIDSLIAFYNKRPDEKYLLFEEFKENDPYGGQIHYTIDIKEYDSEEAKKTFGDEKLLRVGDNLYMKQRTNLASENDSSAIFVQMSGKDIVARLAKLYKMVQLKTIQPPGAMANGLPHRAFPVSKVTLVLKSNSSMACCNHPQDRLTNARYLAPKVAEQDVKVLQCILHGMGYDDEMDWDRYKDDGLFGPRTKSALQAFVEEVNFVERLELAPTTGEWVTAKIACQLLSRCAAGWKRPSYLALADPKWNYSVASMQDGPKRWRSMYHVRQLQADLRLLGFDPTYIDGLFGPLTEAALKRFQEAAKEGMRFDFSTGQLVQTGKVTFAGSANGILDADTRDEITLWMSYEHEVMYEDTPSGTSPANTRMKFADMKEGEIISDPTGRSKIKIMRRASDLYYFVPGEPDAKIVHRPPPLSGTGRDDIETIHWGGDGVFQTAFSVFFSGVLTNPFIVNVFGVARMGDIVDMLLRKPNSLEVMPQGIEIERKKLMTAYPRPSHKRFEEAIRYHMPQADYSLYVFDSRNVEIVRDSDGKVLGSYSKLVDLQISHSGDVRLTWDDPVGVVTVTFDLRSTFSPTGHGALVDDPKRTELADKVRALGFKVTELGSRFTITELEAAVEILDRWKGAKGVAQSLKDIGAPEPSLIKDLLVSGGSYNTSTSEVKIPGYLEMSEEEQRNVVVHEIAHTFFHAAGLRVDSAAVPVHVKELAKEMHEQSEFDIIKEGAITEYSSRKKRTVEEWEKALSTSKALNDIWYWMHSEFDIHDIEFSSDKRGMEIADESRYLGKSSLRGDVVGHGFDNTSEFVSSFVASSLYFQSEMTAAVKSADSASLKSEYKGMWNWVNTSLVKLGDANPYD